MTRIAWGSHGERLFEAGTDRGVLYLPGLPGVPWNGLKSVNESPEGGEPRPYYVDGYKYLNVASAEEYKATLEAFSSPREFAECDGRVSLHNGLFATQQPRRPFSFSYRTLIGNDTQGIDYGYKIHIVYNALAAPSQKNNQTNGDSVTPLNLSWGITVTPPKMTGLKPTAHMVIDSRLTPPKLLKEIEDILYGSAERVSSLPNVQELMAIFKDVGPIARRNTLDVPRPETYVGSGWNSTLDLRASPEPNWIGGVIESSQNFRFWTGASQVAYAAGDEITLTVRYRVTANVGATEFVTVAPHVRTGDVSYIAGQATRPIVVDQDEVVTLHLITPVDIPAGELDLSITTTTEDGSTRVPAEAGFAIQATDALIEPGWTEGTYFDGSTPDTEVATYEWLDLPGLSQSTMKSWY